MVTVIKGNQSHQVLCGSPSGSRSCWSPCLFSTVPQALSGPAASPSCWLSTSTRGAHWPPNAPGPRFPHRDPVGISVFPACLWLLESHVIEITYSFFKLNSVPFNKYLFRAETVRHHYEDKASIVLALARLKAGSPEQHTLSACFAGTSSHTHEWSIPLAILYVTLRAWSVAATAARWKYFSTKPII